jgi:hypothetical protein
LCETAIHKQFDSRDVAAVVLPSGTRVEIIFLRCSPVSEEASRSFNPGVSVEPGLTAFTRMRPFTTSAHYDRDTFYTFDARGYIDYPFYEGPVAAWMFGAKN